MRPMTAQLSWNIFTHFYLAKKSNSHTPVKHGTHKISNKRKNCKIENKGSLKYALYDIRNHLIILSLQSNQRHQYFGTFFSLDIVQKCPKSYKDGNNSRFWLIICKIYHLATSTHNAEVKLPKCITRENIWPLDECNQNFMTSETCSDYKCENQPSVCRHISDPKQDLAPWALLRHTGTSAEN